MKHKIYIVWLAMMAVVLPMQASSMSQADALYSQGKYAQAAEHYQTILTTGKSSADLYYNLGNTYYRMGKIADAIIHYERALRLDAGHEDAKHNLAFVQTLTVDKIDPIGSIFLVDWWKYIYRLAMPDVWAYISVTLFIICLVGVILFVFGRQMWLRKTGFALSIACLCFTIITACCASSRQAELTDTSVAIVYIPTVTIKSSPDNSGNDLFILHEGTKVFIKSSVGEWVEITTQDGNTGWLPTSSIAVI